MTMPRWLWFLPVGLLTLVVAYTGVKLGIERAHVTESDVITYYADQYLADHAQVIGAGATLTDCVGLPGTVGQVWVEVRCTPPGGEAAFLYGAARSGALLYAARENKEPEA